MKTMVIAVLMLALAVPLCAETYSWEDDEGTLNFTEDYSRIPSKYRKKVQRREGMSYRETNVDLTPPDSSVEKTDPPDSSAEKSEEKSAEGPTLYGGKTEDQWRSELYALESEMNTQREIMKDLEQQMKAQETFTKTRANELKKQYDEARKSFEQKYAAYNQLTEAARKAGFMITVK